MSLNDNLVSFWKLGEASGNSRADSIGSNTLAETVGAVASATGKIGNAASFNEGSYLSISDNASLSLTGNLTICAWVNINASITLDFPGIIGKWTQSGNQLSYALRYHRTVDKFRFSASSDGANVTAAVFSDSFGALTKGTWYFVVCFVDLDNDIIGLSVNDGTVDTAAYTAASVFDSTAPLTVGFNVASNNAFFGLIDALGIWSRKLTTSEITELFNSGTGLEPPFDAGDLTVQSATHAHTATNIDIDTGEHNLVVQNATHSHTAENVSFGGGGPLFDDCTAAYKLSDLTDATGRGNDLTNNNSATFNTGKIGNAVYLTAASSQSLSIASNADVQLGNTDWTVAGWFWRGADAIGSIVTKFNDSSGNREFSVEYNTNDSLRFSVWNAGASEFRATWGSSLALSTWHCFIAWHDAATDTIFLQVNNGTPISTSTSGSIQGVGTAPFIIGARDVSGSERYFDGRIDNINVLKRVWSSDERTEFWNAGNGVEFSASQSSPTANAGLDQVRMEFETVMLDGSQSRDADGGAGISRSWTQVSGPAVTINNATSINPTFTAPDVASPTDLVFKLTVQNQFSLTDEDQVTINIVPTGSTTWLSHTPQEAGMDPDEFYDALALLHDKSMVIRNGRVIGTRGDVTLEGFVWSAAKSLVALIFARQLQLGNVGYDDTVPGSDNPSAPLATYRHFLAMLSDFALDPHDPGDQFAYNNLAVHHYGTHLKTTFYAGLDHVQTLQSAFVTALAFEDTLTYNAAGLMSGWDGGWSMSTRDLARIHQLVLNGGVWNGTQILNADFCNSQLYTLQVPGTATLNPDFGDVQSNESVQQGLDLADGYSLGFWLSHLTPHINGISQNEACGMSGAYGTSSYISRQKNLIVVACNVGGTTINNNSVKIPGATFDLFADALPEQRASSRLTRGSLHNFFDDEEINRTEFLVPTVADHQLAIQDSSHAHTVENVTFTQTHVLAIQNSSHGHSAQNVVLLFTARASSRLHRGSMFAFFDDEDLNRTEFWEVSTETTLSIQDATHSHTVEDLTLTQAHTLAIQNASHGHTTENTILTQAHTLAVQDSSHAQASENLTLAQVHSLAVDSASHAHTADSAALAQDHQLAIGNASHGHAADSLTLSQVHALAVDSAVHDQTSENVLLSTAGDLVIANSSHSHAAESLVLTQAHSLEVDGGSHSHVAESLELTGTGDLVIQSAAHEHSAQSFALTQVHELAVLDSIHSHAADSFALTQEHSLVVQDGSHEHVADSPTLTQTHELSIADATHNHTADTLTLAQVHELLIDSASHTHTAEDLELAAEGTLGIQNGAHGHSSESLTLTQAHQITIAGSGHGHISESLTIAVTYHLEVQSSDHAHSSAGLVFTQAHTLVTASTTHGHLAGHLSLTEVYNLNIQSAVHSQTAENLGLTQVYALVVADSVHSHLAQNVLLGSPDDLTISDSFHAHTARNVSFAWTMPADVFEVAAESRVFVVPEEERIFQV